jgi:hypothetical protein
MMLPPGWTATEGQGDEAVVATIGDYAAQVKESKHSMSEVLRVQQKIWEREGTTFLLRDDDALVVRQKIGDSVAIEARVCAKASREYCAFYLSMRATGPNEAAEQHAMEVVAMMRTVKATP